VAVLLPGVGSVPLLPSSATVAVLVRLLIWPGNGWLTWTVSVRVTVWPAARVPMVQVTLLLASVPPLLAERKVVLASRRVRHGHAGGVLVAGVGDGQGVSERLVGRNLLTTVGLGDRQVGGGVERVGVGAAVVGRGRVSAVGAVVGDAGRVDDAAQAVAAGLATVTTKVAVLLPAPAVKAPMVRWKMPEPGVVSVQPAVLPALVNVVPAGRFSVRTTPAAFWLPALL